MWESKIKSAAAAKGLHRQFSLQPSDLADRAREAARHVATASLLEPTPGTAASTNPISSVLRSGSAPNSLTGAVSPKTVRFSQGLIQNTAGAREAGAELEACPDRVLVPTSGSNAGVVRVSSPLATRKFPRVMANSTTTEPENPPPLASPLSTAPSLAKLPPSLASLPPQDRTLDTDSPERQSPLHSPTARSRIRSEQRMVMLSRVDSKSSQL